MKTLEMLQNLKAESGTNKKLDLLKSYLIENPVLQDVFHLALSSESTFGIKKIPEYTPSTTQPYLALSAALETLAERFATNEETGNERISHFTRMLEMMREDEAKVLEMVVQKKLDCGISVTNANKVLSNKIPEFKVMLCSKNEKKTLDKIKLEDMILQTKLDGMRVIVSIDHNGIVKYRTRQGKEFVMADKYTEYFSRYTGYVFDGEAVIKKDDEILDRKTGNGIMNSIRQGKASDEDMDSVVLALWDMVSYDGFFEGQDTTPYRKRFADMQSNNLLNLMSFIMLPLTFGEVTSEEEITKFYELNIAGGEEGIIIKDGSKPYEAKRVKHQIKMKAEESADLIVVGVEEGTGKNEGKLGALVCETADGLLRVNVGIGFSDAQRIALWDINKLDEPFVSSIGKIVEVTYNEVIQSRGKEYKSLFLPVFVEFRTDKNVANTLEELK
jgi:ATP-dependent DNA ligase